MTNPAPARKKTLGQIEVMRAVAVTGIFLFHLWSDVPKAGTENPFGPVFGMILSQGWMGVILFNIVSGFVLTLPFAGPSGRPMPGYVDFLRARFLRICPNYLISLTFWAIVAVLLGTAKPNIVSSYIQHVFFVHTLNPAVFFDIAPAYWWMGLLAQFYLAYPLLWRFFVTAGPRKAATRLIGGCFGFWAAMELMSIMMPTSIFSMGNYLFYFNLPYRLGEFALGMYLACLWRDPAANPVLGRDAPLSSVFGGWRLTAWIALIGLALWGILAGVPKPVLLVTHLYWMAVTLSFGILVFCSEAMDRLGGWAPVAGLAAASYSVYLMHQPIMGYASAWLAPHMAPFPAFLLLAGLCGLLSFLAARMLDTLVARVNARIR